MDGHQQRGALRSCNDPRNGNPQNVSKFLKLLCVAYSGDTRGRPGDACLTPALILCNHVAPRC